jgi:hypothetical protein
MVDDSTQAEQPPKPDPALKRLDKLVGTWDLRGRTLGAKEDDVAGKTTFEWLPGGFFLQQRFQATFMGMSLHSLELIGYDPSTGTSTSNVYSNMWGQPIPYRWDVQGNNVTISVEGAKMTGTISEDGNAFSGGWRPDPGQEGPGNVPYDFASTRVK